MLRAGVARAGNPGPCGLRAFCCVSFTISNARHTTQGRGAGLRGGCCGDRRGYPGVMPGWITSGPPRRDLPPPPTPPSSEHPLSPLLARFGSISCFRVASWRNCGPFSLVSFQPVQRGTLTPASAESPKKRGGPGLPGAEDRFSRRVVAAQAGAHGAGRAYHGVARYTLGMAPTEREQLKRRLAELHRRHSELRQWVNHGDGGIPEVWEAHRISKEMDAIRRRRGAATQQDGFYLPWHALYFFPLPQGQGELRPTSGTANRASGF